MSWDKPTAEPIDGKIQSAVVFAAGCMTIFAVVVVLGSWLIDGLSALF